MSRCKMRNKVISKETLARNLRHRQPWYRIWMMRGFSVETVSNKEIWRKQAEPQKNDSSNKSVDIQWPYSYRRAKFACILCTAFLSPPIYSRQSFLTFCVCSPKILFIGWNIANEKSLHVGMISTCLLAAATAAATRKHFYMTTIFMLIFNI